MSLHSGREPENLERIQEKLHSEGPQPAGGFKPTTFLLWGDSTDHTTGPPTEEKKHISGNTT